MQRKKGTGYFFVEKRRIRREDASKK